MTLLAAISFVCFPAASSSMAGVAVIIITAAVAGGLSALDSWRAGKGGMERETCRAHSR